MQTDLPKIEYWKTRPEEWLLDEELRAVGVRAAGALWFVILNLKLATPPGVMAANEEKLRAFSRLSPREWQIDREPILARLVLYPKTSTWHHEPTKAKYVEYLRAAHEFRLAQYEKAIKRWAGSKKHRQPPLFCDPYACHGMPRDAMACHGIERNRVSESESRVDATACHGIPGNANSKLVIASYDGQRLPAPLTGEPPLSAAIDAPPPESPPPPSELPDDAPLGSVLRRFAKPRPPSRFNQIPHAPDQGETHAPDQGETQGEPAGAVSADAAGPDR